MLDSERGVEDWAYTGFCSTSAMKRAIFAGFSCFGVTRKWRGQATLGSIKSLYQHPPIKYCIHLPDHNSSMSCHNCPSSGDKSLVARLLHWASGALPEGSALLSSSCCWLPVRPVLIDFVTYF